MGKGKPRGLNSARKLRVHRRNKYVIIKKKIRIQVDLSLDTAEVSYGHDFRV